MLVSGGMFSCIGGFGSLMHGGAGSEDFDEMKMQEGN